MYTTPSPPKPPRLMIACKTNYKRGEWGRKAPTHEYEPAEGGFIDGLLPAVHDGVVGGRRYPRQAKHDEDPCKKWR